MEGGDGCDSDKHCMKSSSELTHIDGIVPIIPSPFDRDEQIDWQALRGLVEFACASGARAVCLPAYASEFYKMSEEERRQVVVEVVGQAAGRLPVIAQVNHLSAKHAREFAIFGQTAGAGAVCVSVPRLFALPEGDLFRYFDRILKAIDIPVIIQDFNPGGQSLSAQFIALLHRAHPHFRFVKLEEPMMLAKAEAIFRETQGEVGVLEGWGGMYMLELVPGAVCGVMPGLACADILAMVYRLLSDGLKVEACEVFEVVLPQIVFSLQNMELFHHAEKALLQARGILPQTVVREARLALLPSDEEHIRFLNGRILALLDRLGLPHDPALGVILRET
jgi:dihydrodipicolinate synthase/N-acetylneuraminate lyase